jgi:hypothetical protein
MAKGAEVLLNACKLPEVTPFLKGVTSGSLFFNASN